MQYEVGKTYRLKDSNGNLIDPILCEKGFHACQKVNNCFTYYKFDPTNKIAEVKLSGTIIGENDIKQCSNIIKIIKEVSWSEMLVLANIGNGCSGHSNSGDYNSGDYNSGNSNSGNYNSGNSNSGDYNSGRYNSGNYNSGNSNSGNYNSGDYNSGKYNSGKYNSGKYNSGDYNSGYYNSGNSNSGNSNSGDYNSGYYNSGKYNSGNSNSGDYNSGNSNSGDYNSGNSNSGDYNSGRYNSGDYNSGNSNSGNYNSGNSNSGYFNTKTSDKIYVFNKLVLRDVWEKAIKPKFLYFELTIWVIYNNMTEQEKIDNPNAFVSDGYLKNLEYKEAWSKSFKSATPDDIEQLKALPNFDAKVFEEISGIKIK